ncbi:hypothetical protein ACFPRL_35810 [Pseudoclavibacter helvolus]
MVRDVRAGQLQLAREHGRIARGVQQSHQDPGARRVRHGPAEPVHDVEARSNSQHVLNYTASADQSLVISSPPFIGRRVGSR